VCCEVRARSLERKISEQRRKRKSGVLFSFRPAEKVDEENKKYNFFRRLSFRAGKHEREDVIGTHSPQIENNSFTSLVFRVYSRERVSERERERAQVFFFEKRHSFLPIAFPRDTKEKSVLKKRGMYQMHFTFIRIVDHRLVRVYRKTLHRRGLYFLSLRGRVRA